MSKVTQFTCCLGPTIMLVLLPHIDLLFFGIPERIQSTERGMREKKLEMEHYERFLWLGDNEQTMH